MTTATKDRAPKLEGRGGRLFRRSAFVAPEDDGTRINTMFGPGQRPDAISRYSPPTDWPRVGSLLRPPQVVWISAVTRPVFHSRPFDFGVQPNTGLAPVPAERILRGAYSPLETGEGFSPPLNPAGPYYYVTIPNVDLADYREMQELANGVADALSELRPNRTWAYNVDWFSWDPRGDAATPPLRPYSGVTETGEHFMVRYPVFEPGVLHLWTPGADANPFYGTDFLHIFMGMPTYCGGGGLDYFTPTSGDPLATGNYTRARDGVVANAGKFTRFAVRAYGNDQSWESYPNWPVDGDLYAGDTEGRTFNESTAAVNAENAARPAGGNAYLSLTCADAAAAAPAADIRYMGVRNGVSLDDLVALVAGHYGFDKDTGRDVG